jgi:hypothetical protein
MYRIFEGDRWREAAAISTDRLAFYPSAAPIQGGGFAVVWEVRDNQADEYALVVRCFDGTRWAPPGEIYRDTAMARYASAASHADSLHLVWFSDMEGNNEVYYTLMRR